MVEECSCCNEDDRTNEQDHAPGDEAVSTSVVMYSERLPAERRGGALANGVRNLPAPVVKTAAAVAVGAVVQVGVVLAGKYLAAQSGQKAAKALAANSRGRGKRQASRTDDAQDEGTTVSETLIVRRVWIRRDRD